MKYLPFLLVCAGMMVSCSGVQFEKTEIVLVRSDGTEQKIAAELAVTQEQQARGFMERKNIPEGTGMLFVFDSDQIASFWMKNTPSPLSIAYIDSSGRIRDIFDMRPYSLSPVPSSVSVRYALEVPKGWFLKANITVGDRLKLPVGNL